MTRTISTDNVSLVALAARSARCRFEEKKVPCENRTRLLVVIPLADIGKGGTPGTGAVRVCGAHLEEALRRLRAPAR